jgi:hypothetical protein
MKAFQTELEGIREFDIKAFEFWRKLMLTTSRLTVASPLCKRLANRSKS